ncbi:protein RESTRICTED TEV MOVEMENT 2-like [Malania oleifera]|uniref:protein RESTRICTED TEV MOVEMENT 2-like n=1 Tax=Malania oleifera TaxID=397392 RepID=UPI0025AE9403|nr:protein RESTRICTED TEV MOVEMENT 2-like [Malania oleifera]
MDARSSRVTFEDFEPVWELTQEKDCDTLILYLPGFRKEQIRVQLIKARLLRVSGERPLDNNKWGRFSKDFSFPSNCDTTKVAAKFDNGMLYVRQPKIITQEEQQETEKPAAREEKPAREAPRPAAPMADSQAMEEKQPRDQTPKLPTPSQEPQANGKELENANSASQSSPVKQKQKQSNVKGVKTVPSDTNGKTDAPADADNLSQKALEGLKASADWLAETAKAMSTVGEKQENVSDTINNAAVMEEAEQNLSGGIRSTREYYKQVVNGLLVELRNRRRQVNLIAIVLLALLFGHYVKNYIGSSKESEN